MVVDLSPQGEVRSQAKYAYELLEQIQGAGDLIVAFSSKIWAQTGEFEMPLICGLSLRWCESGEGVGLATVSEPGQSLSISVIASGLNPNAEKLTFQAFQQHILHELHDTGIEPAFDLINLQPRPLVATVGLFAPSDPGRNWAFAVADRCFGAAYFRSLQLA